MNQNTNTLALPEEVASAVPVPPEEVVPAQRRILIAEDNDSNRKHLRQLLATDPVLRHLR